MQHLDSVKPNVDATDIALTLGWRWVLLKVRGGTFDHGFGIKTIPDYWSHTIGKVEVCAGT